jgi:PAS domain S-box-containing protein
LTIASTPLTEGAKKQAVAEDDLHAGETKILQMIAKGIPLHEVLDSLTRFIESQAEGVHCALGFIDAELLIRPASAPSLSSEYNGKLDGMPIFPCIGPCCLAAYMKQQVISENIETDARWSDWFRSLTKSYGLKACWSTPILDSNAAVIGTFAMYLKRPSTPDSRHLGLIEIATRLSGVAIERRLKEERLHLCAQIIERTTEAVRISDHKGAIVEQNAAHRKMFGISDEALKGRTAAIIFGEEQAARVLALLNETGRFDGELVSTIDGKSRVIDVSAFVVQNQDGKVIYRVAMNRDVTEQRNAEESLRNSHADLEYQVVERTLALRNLSTRLLRTQDDERRRVARDLHDSTGQTLTALKLAVAALQEETKQDRSTFNALSDIADIADRALQEIRTTSYLLHPPLLDEAGFASAARWYVEGFAERSGVQISFEPPSGLRRMPEGVEIALFRVLQESLTNVHRHSGSKKAEIRVLMADTNVTMVVRDFGFGLPAGMLERLHTSRSGVGVGLVGMRERIRELGGQLDIQSDTTGTTLTASVPI